VSEVVEVRLGATVAKAVSRLAASVGESSFSLPLPRQVAKGEWVRFVVKLDDGTPVIEGVGRCSSSLPRGNPVDHYDVVLSELQFDERNEIMFERVLIAHEAAEKGDDTGAIKLDSATIEAIEDQAAAADHEISAKPVRKPGVPPPLAKSAGARDSRPEARKSTPPARDSRPEARKSTPPARDSRPEARKSTPPARDADTKLDIARPAHRPRTASVRPAPIEDTQLVIESALVGRARALAPRLPRRLLDREERPGKPEEAVLRAAVRIGLAALAAIADDEEGR
jgi:hypothetical protein